MREAIDLRPVLRFLKGLRTNNNREWFQANRVDFEEAYACFEVYVAELIHRLSATEPLASVTPKDCIFRLYRDLRFSKDKTPYKPYLSAYIAPGGRRTRQLGYYVHIEPGNRSMLGGGLHEAEPRQIEAWRASVDRNPGPLLKILRGKAFRDYFGEVQGEKLKTAPRGYAKDHPQLDLLRLKSVTVSHPLSDKEVSSSRLLRETLLTFKAMRPFLRYLEAL